MDDIRGELAKVTSVALYRELAKWERHRVGHSLGYLNLTQHRLWFVPHARSVIAKGFDIPLETIALVERSDNWFWRGAVTARLKQPLRLDIEFLLDPDSLMPGLEQKVFQSDTLRLFLGFHRNKFLGMVEQIGIPTGDARR